MKPSAITQDQWIKVAKAAGYVGISAILSYLIAFLADKPEAFGALTPVVNVLLVTIKQIFTKE